MFDVDNGGVLPKYGAELFSAAVSGNSKRKRVNSGEGAVNGPHHMAKLSHSHCFATVRHVAFSPSDSSIIVCCEDGCIWRWDR